MNGTTRPPEAQATAWLLAAAALVLGIVLGRTGGEGAPARVLGETTRVVIAEGGIGYTARLDTGAAVTSVHALDIEVVDGDPADLMRNKGKTVRYTLVNEDGARARMSSRIERVQRVRTGPCVDYRYHVHLTIAHGGRSQRTLVNLNDRSYAREKMLLGRNWIRQGYLVKVGS